MKKLDSVIAGVAKERKNLFISPEGTRSRDGKIGLFKKGAFHLAIKGKVPVTPVVVCGAYDLMPHNAFIPRRGTMIVKCLPSIDTSHWSVDTIERHMDEVRSIMIAAHEQMSERLPAFSC